MLELHDIGRRFDRVSGIHVSSSLSSRDRDVNWKDERLMLTKLLDANVFDHVPGRLGHQGFLDLSADPFSENELDVAKLKRYCLRFGVQYGHLQRGLYSRLYPVPLSCPPSSRPLSANPIALAVRPTVQFCYCRDSTLVDPVLYCRRLQ